MNYPVWDITTIGGGSLIASIAILHVLISHFAVGGGFFLWITDRQAARASDQQLADFVRKHVRFFLLLTMVAGGMTGVGIWFVISLVQPSATSSLIHTFVFAWAIEWVFFLVEIVALLVYHYRFDALTERDRLRVSFIYLLSAWLSLAVINGMLSFMLTPGRWVETHSIWDGFFNPTYPASLAYRSCMAMTLAGLFGYITALRNHDDAFRLRLVAYCSKWLVVPIVGLVPSALWYYSSVPEETRTTSFALNPQTTPFVGLLFVSSTLIFLAGILMMRRWPLGVQRLITAFLVVIGVSWIGSFEYVREISRKPFVISGFMYDSAIRVDQLPELDRDGILRHAGWSSLKMVTKGHRAEAGREIFRLECQCCHTIHGIRNDIALRVQRFSYPGLLTQLSSQGNAQNFMPPFIGTEEEKEALAYYLTTVVNGGAVDDTSQATFRNQSLLH